MVQPSFGVVVLGIVIALSGEQLIEHLHDKHKAGEAREGIREEIAMNIAVLESRSAAQRCIDRRIDDIAALLQPSGSFGMVVRQDILDRRCVGI